MKKVFFTLLALLLPMLSTAQYTQYIDGIMYNIIRTSEGFVAEVASCPYNYTGEIVIPSTVNYQGSNYSVTSIGSRAFYCCSALTSITIPNSVTSIGDDAFYCCSALTSITIPNSVTSIGNDAFYRCSALTSITIPNSVTSIGYYAFSGCSALTSITIPNSVTSIRYHAFKDCSALTSITVEVGNPTYDSRNNCNAIIETDTKTLLVGCKNTVIPNSVIGIGVSAFSGCSGLTSITIPNSVTSIEGSAFSGCTGLTSITIPNSVITIGGSAFSGCTGLTSITIPNSVTTIGGSAFSGCTGLTSITIPNSVTTIWGSAFSGCTGLTSITIPNSVTTIWGSAFSGCTGLTSITIPNNVTSIGGGAFYGCSALTSITIPSSVTKIEDSLFENCSALTSIIIPYSVASIGEYAFTSCSALSSITIPSSVTSIAYHAFTSCSALSSITVEAGNPTYDSRNNCNAIIEKETNVLLVACKGTVIPNSVTRIGYYAFENCSALTSITIPSSVTSIEKNAFSGCSALSSISVEAGNPIYDSRNNCNAIIITRWNELLVGCKNTVIPNSVTEIRENAFSGCTTLTSITIPNSVTSIESNAFKDCSALTVVVINSNKIVSKSYGSGGIGSIFGDQVQEYVLGNDITSIGKNAFRNCTGITSITIPANVTSIGTDTFEGCKLHNILVRGTTPPVIAADSFTDMMYHHTILYVPAGSWDAYVFDSNWYVFNNIRELAIKEEQVLEQQTYMLMNTNNFSYSVYDPVNDGVGVIKSFNSVNEDNPNHCWQLLEAAGKHYIYNVGAKKFLIKANNEIGLALSDRPEAINFQDGADGIILGGDTSKNWAMVRNESTFANQQIITGIDLVSNSTPMDNGSVYNLSGQRIVSLQKGVNIINGRKVLVK